MQHGRWQHFNQIVMCSLSNSTLVDTITWCQLMVNEVLTCPSPPPRLSLLFCCVQRVLCKKLLVCVSVYSPENTVHANRKQTLCYKSMCIVQSIFRHTGRLHVHLFVLTFLNTFYQGLLTPHWICEHWKYVRGFIDSIFWKTAKPKQNILDGFTRRQ